MDEQAEHWTHSYTTRALYVGEVWVHILTLAKSWQTNASAGLRAFYAANAPQSLTYYVSMKSFARRGKIKIKIKVPFFNICLCLVLHVCVCYFCLPSQLWKQGWNATDLICLWPSNQTQSGFSQFKEPTAYPICATAFLRRSADFIGPSVQGDKWKPARPASPQVERLMPVT